MNNTNMNSINSNVSQRDSSPDYYFHVKVSCMSKILKYSGTSSLNLHIATSKFKASIQK